MSQKLCDPELPFGDDEDFRVIAPGDLLIEHERQFFLEVLARDWGYEDEWSSKVLREIETQ